jgi:hypothetical protein
MKNTLALIAPETCPPAGTEPHFPGHCFASNVAFQPREKGPQNSSVKILAGQPIDRSGEQPCLCQTCRFHLADLLVQALDLGTNGEQRLSRISPDIRERVGLQPGALESVTKEVLSLLGEIQDLFLCEEKAA